MCNTLHFAQHEHQGAPINFPVLAPNLKGLQNAHAAGAQEIVVFTSVTEAFVKANLNCTVAETIAQAWAVTKQALSMGIRVRASVYLSRSWKVVIP